MLVKVASLQECLQRVNHTCKSKMQICYISKRAIRKYENTLWMWNLWSFYWSRMHNEWLWLLCKFSHTFWIIYTGLYDFELTIDTNCLLNSGPGYRLKQEICLFFSAPFSSVYNSSTIATNDFPSFKISLQLCMQTIIFLFSIKRTHRLI